MANFIHLAFCAFLSVSLSIDIVHGHPITPEDVESLLPETPKTKNETVAAIVVDPVIQEAVQSVVGDGTLSGLVVKKNTVILPAAEPEVVISQKEQILKAPLSHLEDIRKNITETAATISEKENSEVSEVEEISLAEVIPVDDKVITESSKPEIFIPAKAPENHPLFLTAQDSISDKKKEEESLTNLPKGAKLPIEEKLVVPGILESEIKLPEGVYPDKITLPDVIHDEISKPLVAILNTKNVTLVDNPSGLISSKSSIENSFENNPTPEFGARIPVAVVTSEEPADLRPAVTIEMKTFPEEKIAKNVLAVFALAEDENLYNYNENDDMVAAEDIIFRPLFRYRQQQNERRRILENRSYLQRPSYNRYRPSSSSSREDYNSVKNSYRKPQRTRYYNDYY